MSLPLTLNDLEGKPSYDQLEKENSELKAQVVLLKRQIAVYSTNLELETDPTTPNSPPMLQINPTKQYKTPTPHLFTPYHNITDSGLLRFSRHLILKQVSPATQNKWLHSRVLVIGMGGLGAPVALYLAAAGVGHMTLVDADVVDESNLHRQVIHNEPMVGQPKVISAADQCLKINSGLSLTLIQDTLHSGNAIKLGLDHDIIVDCTDNVTARYLTSDAAVYCNKPLISAAVVGTNGQLTTYCFENGPCYRCINPTPPPPETVMSCADAGVIGALVGVVGTTQALEALKVLARMKLLNEPTFIEPSTQFHASWPQKLGPDFTPLSESMVFWDGMSTGIRKAQMRPRQDKCMCATLRPSTNNGPQKLAPSSSPRESVELEKNDCDNTNNNNNNNNNTDALTDEEIELIEIDLQKRTVEWACELEPKAVHKPPEDGVDISSPMEAMFRLDRIEVGIIKSRVDEQKKFTDALVAQNNHTIQQTNDSPHSPQLTPYTVSPDVKSRLGNLLYPLLVDVRFPEQFQIVSIPSSVYCENFTMMRTPNELRDLLWDVYYQRYPDNCEENPKLAEFLVEKQTQDEVAIATNETRIQRKRRYRQYQLEQPAKYQLKHDVINLFNYTSQQEQECILNLHLKPKTVIHSLPELSITSPRNSGGSAGNADVSISPTEKVIFNELEHLPILHTSLLCRRGRWTMMLLDWLAKYIFTTYFHLFTARSDGTEGGNQVMSVNLKQTIPTISATFAYMSIFCGFPPMILSDVFGGLTALTKVYPDFPTY